MNKPSILIARRTWLVPILLIVGLAVALPAVYLAGTVDPQGHLSGLPVGLVVEEQTPGGGLGAADDVARAIERGTEDRLSVTRLMPGAGTITVPVVSILTNAGDGGLSTGLLVGNLTPVLQQIAGQLGK